MSLNLNLILANINNIYTRNIKLNNSQNYYFVRNETAYNFLSFLNGSKSLSSMIFKTLLLRNRDVRFFKL